MYSVMMVALLRLLLPSHYNLQNMCCPAAVCHAMSEHHCMARAA
jgi:hypothetical protein